MTKEIPLTRGKFALVDDDDYPELSKHKWRVSGEGYALRSVKAGGKSQDIFMHRAILNPPPGFEGDHIDRDRLNNTRANLRIATRAQNAANVSCRNKFRGVRPGKGCWKTIIGDRVIGRYSTAEDAALAYDIAALEKRGEFASLNFPRVAGQIPVPPPQLARPSRPVRPPPAKRIVLDTPKTGREGVTGLSAYALMCALKDGRVQITDQHEMPAGTYVILRVANESCAALDERTAEALRAIRDHFPLLSRRRLALAGEHYYRALQRLDALLHPRARGEAPRWLPGVSAGQVAQEIDDLLKRFRLGA